MRDNSESIPIAITPESLLHGRDLVSLNIIPALQPIPGDVDWNIDRTPADNVRDTYYKLRNVRAKLVDLYHFEFITNLITQATNKPNRFNPILHKKLSIGDIVLLVEKNQKQTNFPMGVVRAVEENNLGEVTSAHIFKGSTRETVYRHVSSLILLIPSDGDSVHLSAVASDSSYSDVKSSRPKRAAAIESSRRCAEILK